MSETGRTTPPGAPPPTGAPTAPPASRRLAPEVRGRVDAYLLRVDAALTQGGATPHQRRTLGMTLRQRIAEKLAGGAVDVEAVIAAMGAPETHLAEATALPRVPATLKPAAPAPVAPAASPAADAASSTPQYTGPQRISLIAVVGGIWALMFFLMIAAMLLVQGMQRPPQWLGILQLLGWSAPLATTVCGLIAIGRIQRSGGQLYGLSLALCDALLFPLLLLNWIIFWICWRIDDQLTQQSNISPPIQVLIHDIIPTVAVILADYFIVVQSWAALRGNPARRRR